jgi:hypothetical protein
MPGGGKMDAKVGVIGPTAIFAIGLVVIFISGGDRMFLIAGDVLVGLSGLAFIKFMK